MVVITCKPMPDQMPAELGTKFYFEPGAIGNYYLLRKGEEECITCSVNMATHPRIFEQQNLDLSLKRKES